MASERKDMVNKELLVRDYCKTHNDALKEDIVRAYKPLVEFIARKLTFHRDDLDDLIQVGNIGLLRSLDRFDPTMETDFSTFVTPNIIGEIKHYFRDKKNIVKVPRRLHELYSKVKRVLKEHQVMGHSPTYSQIAAELEVTEEQVLECMEAGKSSTVLSLDGPAHAGSSDGDSSPSLADNLGGEHHETMYINRITLNDAMSTLSDREQKILQLRFYSGLSQMEIAEHMNLSQMHISRLLTKSLEVLRKKLEKN
jgi:RNA polymerase sigma-B factor